MQGQRQEERKRPRLKEIGLMEQTDRQTDEKNYRHFAKAFNELRNGILTNHHKSPTCFHLSVKFIARSPSP